MKPGPTPGSTPATDTAGPTGLGGDAGDAGDAERAAPTAGARRPEVDTVIGDQVVRFDRVERWLHGVNAVLVLALIVTGSLLYVGALGGLVGRRDVVRAVHLYVGLAVPVPFVLALAGRWNRGLRRDAGRLGRFLTDDWLWLRRRFRRSATLRIGKFNAGQKVNAVLVASALPVMFATGVLLHWQEPLSDSLRTGTTFVHDWGYLALTALVVGHIVKALAEPVSLRAMRTGLVPRAWAREEHPRWHAELAGPDGPEPDRGP